MPPPPSYLLPRSCCLPRVLAVMQPCGNLDVCGGGAATGHAFRQTDMRFGGPAAFVHVEDISLPLCAVGSFVVMLSPNACIFCHPTTATTLHLPPAPCRTAGQHVPCAFPYTFFLLSSSASLLAPSPPTV